MLKKKLFIAGSSSHAKVVIDIFERRQEYDILGLLDSFRQKGEDTYGYYILGKVEDLPKLLNENPGAEVFVAIGDNWGRYTVVEKIKELIPEVLFASAIHPDAVIGKNVKLGKGVAVTAGAVVCIDSVMGDFSIVNTLSGLDHESTMLPFSSLSAGVIVGSNVIIGEFTAIAIRATIIHQITIGCHTLIGAGAVVLRDVGNNAVAYGVPAKEIRKREIGEKYF